MRPLPFRVRRTAPRADAWRVARAGGTPLASPRLGSARSGSEAGRRANRSCRARPLALDHARQLRGRLMRRILHLRSCQSHSRCGLLHTLVEVVAPDDDLLLSRRQAPEGARQLVGVGDVLLLAWYLDELR